MTVEEVQGIPVPLPDPLKRRLATLNQQEAAAISAAERRFGELRGEALGGFLAGKGIDAAEVQIIGVSANGEAVVYRPPGWKPPKPKRGERT